MVFYVNETSECMTVLVCRTMREAEIYAGWANENLGVSSIRPSTTYYNNHITGDRLLGYFGFTIDSLVDRVFTLMPVRTRVDSNKLLIKTMLKNPTLSKASCCLQVDKYPTHYSRLSNTLSEHCAWVGLLSGGRNPMKLLRGIRGHL
ncbi:hypothetical protein FKH56_22335 [Salmonella enterica]|nr:hypothetical protein [Salmonella enterica]ECO2536476.1 hypothetical protein [Salmonella enterica]ECO8581913.1 hypothetical protein [Salmonella enterica]EJD1261251.1 hypothetical protein [Salmonella enterica]ELS8375480.1 hypothetical protein [Salmonella enterica]